MKAIRLKCLDCSCGSTKEVRLCPIPRRPLHPFRFGKNPYIKKREYTEAQREALRELGQENRAKQLAAKTDSVTADKVG